MYFWKHIWLHANLIWILKVLPSKPGSEAHLIPIVPLLLLETLRTGRSRWGDERGFKIRYPGGGKQIQY